MGTSGIQREVESGTRRYNPLQAFTRRRIILAIPILLTALACLALFALWDSELPTRIQTETRWFGAGDSGQVELAVNPLDPLQSVNGLPTASFRDNLRADTKYISSWGSGGWSNDVISIMNLIYLGLITDRVPILPAFLPSHLMLNTLSTDHVPLTFGDVFDLPRLRQAIGKPILEWRDVKASNSTVLDDLGCWNVWESVQYFDKAPRGSFTPWNLKLDISYTKTPDWVKMVPNFEHSRYSSFWALASLAFPRTRSANLVPPLPSPKHNASLPPDEHLLCYDFLYYVAAHQEEEIGLDYSPAWRYVGQHMRWTARLERLGDRYIRQALGVKEDDPIPPFVAVHVRHNDFEDWCEESITLSECFAPLPVIARRVREVQEEIRERKSIEVAHVIVTSDETNRTWWREVDKLGWLAPDHSRTQELYGNWYTILLDAIIQSKSAGFVGTARSTVSVLAGTRVESWQDGSIRTVQWGKPGADDH
ncbi:hypothetical protein FB451DRAFT_1388779 [Mycena latifolia]|nr:hypothetical protein FB451DRAFT_1388779 [Mycena latifolia]